jgi:AcrR family transcriptional regulator
VNDLQSPWLPKDARQKHQNLKRDAVLAAAARTFGERGFSATRIDDIAEGLNVTKPTIYYYYRTKEALFLACIDSAVEELKQTMGQLKTNASADERVAAFLGEYVLLMTKDLGKCLVNISEFDLKPKASKRLQSAKREVDAMLHAMVEEGMKKGAFEKRDPTVTTFTLFGAANAVARWHKPGGRLAADTLVATIRDLLIRGLLKRSRA